MRACRDITAHNREHAPVGYRKQEKRVRHVCKSRRKDSQRMHKQLALLILDHSYAKSGDKTKIYKLYLRNTRFINGWDLVDTSAPIS
ncbi:MAG TPA: DNA alkylation repair protein [Pyrinomonadaceae bacterium]